LAENEMSGSPVDTVVQRLGITPRTLRYYEEVGLITPAARTSGGHRLYDESTIECLEQILRLKDNLGFSLQGIREILESEQSLEDLRHSFHHTQQNYDAQKPIIDRYIEVLQDLISKMDTKIENLLTMRNVYQERLNRSIRFRDEEMGKR
jgi:MerR family transcriptional regulator, repressor of the yfmOP operon